MGLYEETIEVIVEDILEWAAPVTREVSPKVFEDGYEVEMGCSPLDCKYYGHIFGGNICTYNNNLHSDIRMESGGAICEGQCFEFRSWDDFWDEVSNSYAIDPDTGEVFGI